MKFYIGLHIVSHAWEFQRSFISVNRLIKRKRDLPTQDWILDSGAFTEISKYGYYRFSTEVYVNQINRWACCPNLEMAVTQDYMCEPFILEKTGLTVSDHQRLTIERYDRIYPISVVPIMPVLQGYQPEDYVSHLKMYGDRLTPNMRVGVGSICKRNGRPEKIIRVLQAIKNERPDLRLHGFGLKITSLKDSYITSLLYSADSMAWSFSARKQGRDGNSVEEAKKFYNMINNNMGKRPSQLVLV